MRPARATGPRCFLGVFLCFLVFFFVFRALARFFLFFFGADMSKTGNSRSGGGDVLRLWQKLVSNDSQHFIFNIFHFPVCCRLGLHDHKEISLKISYDTCMLHWRPQQLG